MRCKGRKGRAEKVSGAVEVSVVSDDDREIIAPLMNPVLQDLGAGPSARDGLFTRKNRGR